MRKLFSLTILLLLATSLPAQVKIGGTARVGGTATVRTPPVGGFPNAAIIDDFNRANETPITGWTDTWEVGSVGFSVFSNAARTASNANGTVYRSTTNYGPEVDVAVTLAAVSSYEQVALMLANEGTSGVDGYVLSYGGGSLEFYRVDNGAFNIIAACTASVTLSGGDAVGVRRVTGGNFTTYTCTSGAGCGTSGVGWTQRGTCTDNTYTSAGKVGLRAGGSSSTFDDFRVATQ